MVTTKKKPILTSLLVLIGDSAQRGTLLIQIICIFLVLSVTLVSFLYISDAIDKVAKDSYTHVAETTVEQSLNDFNALEHSVQGLAALVNTADQDANGDVVLPHLPNLFPLLQKFDHVALVKKNGGTPIQYKSLFDRDDRNFSDSRASLIPFIKEPFLQNYLDAIEPHEIGKTFLVFNVPSQEAENNPEISDVNNKLQPLFFIRPVVLEDKAYINNQRHFIIALAYADRVFEAPDPQVTRIILKDLTVGKTLYGKKFSHLRNEALNTDNIIDDKSLNTEEDKERQFSYEFAFADHKWEIALSVRGNGYISFLKTLPYMLLLFGGFIVFMLLLYLRSHIKQHEKMLHVYDAIEQKNIELEREIMQRAELNKAIRRTERENKSIIDAVSDIIFETDAEGKIRFLNARWRKVTGFEAEQSLGLEIFSMLHPDDQERIREDFKLMVRGKENPFRIYTKLRTSDGHFRSVELAISMLRQDEDKQLRVVGTFTDVEERRRAERALGEAEKKYRAIVENAAGGIFQLTPEGVYLSVNPAMARILGYSSPEQILHEIKNANEDVYVSTKDRQGFLKDIETFGYVHNYETQVKRRDGSTIWVNENLRAVRDENGSTLYFEGSIEDITERKKTDIELREAKVRSDMANRAKSEFLANMSHELRTPLNSIIGFSEIIKKEAFGPLGSDSYKEYATDIHDSGTRLLTVINEILDISKIEAGERPLNESLIHMDDVIENAITLLEAKAETHSVKVINEVQSLPDVVAEEIAVKQILINLLSNAIKFTPAGGRVTVSSERDIDGQLRVSISDTGIGLSDDEIKKALSPFGQIHNELSRSNSGTGLGLTLVDALMKLHGGSLELLSQKGIGTTATIVFPSSRIAVKSSKK